MKLKLSLVLSFLSLFIASCDGAALCYDCKQCPALCPAGYVCKEAQLIENGGAKSYHCGLAETKPALTVTPPMSLPDQTPIKDDNSDAGCGDL
jgi:hypothetical protein